MSSHYQSEEEIKAVVKGFESCTTAKDNFPHRSHLTVAVYYIYKSEIRLATQKMRAGLFRFLEYHGVGREKYNETLTIFWLKLINQKMKELGDDHSLLDLTNSVVAALANSRTAFEYYSAERLNSPAAKQRWLEPDLKQLLANDDL